MILTTILFFGITWVIFKMTKYLIKRLAKIQTTSPTLCLKFHSANQKIVIMLAQFEEELNALSFTTAPSLKYLGFNADFSITLTWTADLNFSCENRQRLLTLPTNLPTPRPLFFTLKRLTETDPGFRASIILRSPYAAPLQIKSDMEFPPTNICDTQANALLSQPETSAGKATKLKPPTAPEVQHPSPYDAVLKILSVAAQDQSWTTEYKT